MTPLKSKKFVKYCNLINSLVCQASQDVILTLLLKFFGALYTPTPPFFGVGGVDH